MDNNQKFQAFRKDVQQALTHLYNPDFSPPESILQRIPDAEQRPDAWQTLLTQEITSLQPGPDVPMNSRLQRSYDILTMRYIDKLTQEQAAEQLNMSLRSLQRAQRQAILTLVYRLWNRSCQELEQPTPGTPADHWQEQLDLELQRLEQSAGPPKSDVLTILQATQRINCARAPQRYALNISGSSPGLTTPFHAPILQQVLLSLLDRIAEYAPSDVIEIYVQRVEGHRLRITLTGGHMKLDEEINFPLAERVLAAQENGTLSVINHAPLTIQLDIPLIVREDEVRTILFVDDNTDLAILFETYCTGTPFHLEHVREGAFVQEKIAEVQPDLMILDVMLPDMDGWELLIDLQANPATATIPIIVCSVVPDAHLAVELGAHSYLQKPVWRQQFLDAVTQVIRDK